MFNIECEELDISLEGINKENNIERLLYYKRSLEYILSEIASKIEDYKVAFVEHGVSGDYEWLKRAKAKRRLYGFLNESVKARAGYVNKKNKIERTVTIEKNFIDVCKKQLSEKDFDLILKEAVIRTNINN